MKYLQLEGRERLQIQADVLDLDFSESLSEITGKEVSQESHFLSLLQNKSKKLLLDHEFREWR